MSNIVLLLFSFLYISRRGFELSACLISMSSLKWDRSQPSRMFIARETMHKSRQYQISRHKIFQYSNILKFDTPFYFAYISSPKYCTENFGGSIILKKFGYLNSTLAPSATFDEKTSHASQPIIAYSTYSPSAIITSKAN